MESSSLKSIGYADGIAVIEFKPKTGEHGHLFAYALTPEQLDAFTTAESKGRYYGQFIKGKIAGEKLTGRCSACGSEPEILGEPCRSCGAVNVREIDRVHKEQ